MKKSLKLVLIIIIFLIIIFFYVFKIAKHFPKKIDLVKGDFSFGVTYSKKQAEEIGLDWQEAYLDILDDLKVKKIRIPVYWDQIELEPGVFDFRDYEFLIEEGEKRGVEFILNIGSRVARWPECHFPSWVNPEDKDIFYTQVLRMLEAAVNNFKNYDSIAYWQLENEPLLNSFGICPRSNYNFLKEETSLLKSLDDRPVIISATGELSFWKKEAHLADIFGTTMYRIVHNPFLGYIKYPYSSNFYSFKAKRLNLKPENVFILELQAEPWVSKKELTNIYSTKYQKSFNLDQFRANAQFAINTGFDRAYLWGVEWWYFKYKLGGNSEYWDFAKTLFK